MAQPQPIKTRVEEEKRKESAQKHSFNKNSSDCLPRVLVNAILWCMISSLRCECLSNARLWLIEAQKRFSYKSNHSQEQRQQQLWLEHESHEHKLSICEVSIWIHSLLLQGQKDAPKSVVMILVTGMAWKGTSRWARPTLSSARISMTRFSRLLLRAVTKE